MASLDILPFEVMKMIAQLLPHKDRRALSQTSHRYTGFELALELSTLNVTVMSKCIYIHAPSLERSIANHFASPHQHATETSRRHVSTETADCSRAFAFPPTSQFSFFDAAEIGQLVLGKILLYCVDDDNIKHFAALFSGCRIDSVKMILHWKTTLDDVIFHGDREKMDVVKKELPAFLASVHAKHVEFVVNNNYEIMAPFFHGPTLASAMVLAGVRTITFNGGDLFRRNELFERVNVFLDQPIKRFTKPLYGVTLLLKLFNAGIESVDVSSDRGTQITIPVLDHLLDKLSMVGKSLRLRIHTSNDTIPVGRYSSAEDELKGRIVDVAEWLSPSRRLITIECKPMASNN